MVDSRLQKPHLKWAFTITNGIALVCAVLSYVLDVDPQENPDAPLAALIVVRDSFRCKSVDTRVCGNNCFGRGLLYHSPSAL
jgi:hypothetical protein